MSQKLTNRGKLILEHLIDQSEHVSTTWLSQQLGVSKRTILRELDQVEAYVGKLGLVLDRAVGKGVQLQGPALKRQVLLRELDQTPVDIKYAPQERQHYLLIELLGSNEPRKLFYFASLFNTSEATISGDLDRVDEWLADKGISLVRKPGYGVELLGDERNKRDAILKLLYEQFNRSELLQLVRSRYKNSQDVSAGVSVKHKLLNIIGDKMLEGIEDALEESKALKSHALADSAYVALVVHLSLAIQRLLKGESIKFDSLLLDELRESHEFGLAEDVVEAIGHRFGLHVPEAEVGYVTMHLQGAKLRSALAGEKAFKVNDYEIIHIAEALISGMEKVTGYMLRENDRLFTDLVNHLGPAMTRMRLNMEIRNPLLAQIKSQYPTYYEWTSQVVKHLALQGNQGVPDDEIGYLTMHFGAAIETMTKRMYKKWRVIIACSTGIGSSKLLQARVNKLYTNLDILDVVSTRQIKDRVSQGGADFIIATIPVENVGLPSVVVSPLLLEEDMARIDDLMSTLQVNQVMGVVKTAGQAPIHTRLDRVCEVSTMAKGLMQGYFVVSSNQVDPLNIIQLAVKHVMGHEDKSLVDAFVKRETMGTTYLSDGKSYLLHCRSAGVSHPRFGFIRVEHNHHEFVVAVMVAPLSMNHDTQQLLGGISQLLLDEGGLISLIMNHQTDRSKVLIESVVIETIENILHGVEA